MATKIEGNKRMIRVAICGPIDSVGGNLNFPLFDYVTVKLRAAGCQVYNPVETARELYGSLEDILKIPKKTFRHKCRPRLIKASMVWICDNANVIFLLPGWQQSRGAVAERALAIALDLIIRESPNIVMHDMGMDLGWLTVVEKDENLRP